MWKNNVQPDRPLMTLWRMRIACWIYKATNTHLEYVILIAFSTATAVTRTRLNVTLYNVSCILSTQPSIQQLMMELPSGNKEAGHCTWWPTTSTAILRMIFTLPPQPHLPSLSGEGQHFVLERIKFVQIIKKFVIKILFELVVCLTSVRSDVVLFLFVTECTLMSGYQRFEGKFCLHLQSLAWWVNY
jgi:hypothetical protein